MCGIVGFIYAGKKYNNKLGDVFKQMLYVDAVRGPHSTGVMKLEKGETDWRKAAVPAGAFFNVKNCQDWFFGLGDIPFVVGHNRFATRGNVTNGNAHPFEVKHITLMHNGTLWQQYKLPDGNKFEVDSHAIAHSIASIGIEATAPLMDGAYSLVWLDEKKKTLNFLRNKERPMWLLHCKDDIILFGSEFGILRWIAMRNGLEETKLAQLPEHEVWSFEQDNLKPKIKKVEKYEFKWKQPQYPGGNLRSRYFGLDDDEEAVSPFEKGSRLTGAAAATAAVLQFRKELDGTATTGPKDKITIALNKGDEVLFSVNDFEEKIAQGGFVPVVGELPLKGSDYVVKGNYSGDVTILITSKNLMKGIVTSIQCLKNNRVMIEVKDIRESNILDPHYLATDGDREEWKKNNTGRMYEAKSDAPPIVNDQNMTADGQAKEIQAKELVCADCSAFTPRGKGVSVFRSSKVKWMCMDCFHKWKPSANKSIEANAVKQEHGRVIH